ncbi:hypothetical protein DINM_004264 [Dirofilaria immitis]|nr:hypothetical protein [Dirofilaria immitis]
MINRIEPSAVTGSESSNNELYCNFVAEQRIVQKCLAPFLNKIDFAQFFLKNDLLMRRLYFVNCTEYEHDDIWDRKCGFVQWHLNCSVTDAYNKACFAAAEETSNPSFEQCKFARRYIGCGTTKSFYEACPQITKVMQNYFDILTNANNNNCYLRQQAVDNNETFSGGELFASNWSTKPFIVRLAMDGTQTKKIVTENLVWTNALAVDYFADWADAFRDVIESIHFLNYDLY